MPGKGIKSEQIVSISPAVGWFAKYKQDDGSLEYCRILAWGLVERQYTDNPPQYAFERHLVGFDQDTEGLTELCDSVTNFAGYINAADPGFDMSLVYPPPNTVQVVPGMYSYTYRPDETIVLATEKGLTPIGELIAATEALFQAESPAGGLPEALVRVSNALDAFKKSCGPKA